MINRFQRSLRICVLHIIQSGELNKYRESYFRNLSQILGLRMNICHMYLRVIIIPKIEYCCFTKMKLVNCSTVKLDIFKYVYRINLLFPTA